MLIVNTDYITGKNLEVLGLVAGHVETDLKRAKDLALKEIADQASKLKADAIINVRFSVSGASRMGLCFVSGTAVKFV